MYRFCARRCDLTASSQWGHVQNSALGQTSCNIDTQAVAQATAPSHNLPGFSDGTAQHHAEDHAKDLWKQNQCFFNERVTLNQHMHLKQQCHMCGISGTEHKSRALSKMFWKQSPRLLLFWKQEGLAWISRHEPNLSRVRREDKVL